MEFRLSAAQKNGGVTSANFPDMNTDVPGIVVTIEVMENVDEQFTR
jgi:hypothetical protein